MSNYIEVLAAHDRLEAENEQLRAMLSEKVISSTMLREFTMASGGLTIGLEGGACALMAQTFGKQLYESEAENYIEVTFDSPDYPSLGQITVTVRRETGKTPHQLRLAAEAKVAELQQANADLDRLASQTAALNEKAGMRVYELEQALRVLLRDIESVNPDCGLELEPAVHQARAALSQQAKP